MTETTYKSSNVVKSNSKNNHKLQLSSSNSDLSVYFMQQRIYLKKFSLSLCFHEGYLEFKILTPFCQTLTEKKTKTLFPLSYVKTRLSCLVARRWGKKRRRNFIIRLFFPTLVEFLMPITKSFISSKEASSTFVVQF